MCAERIDKVTGIFHANAIGNLRYRQVGCAQQLLCARQAQLRQIFAGRLAEVVLEAALEMVFADIIARRERIERELLRVLLVQILPHLLQNRRRRLQALLRRAYDFGLLRFLRAAVAHILKGKAFFKALPYYIHGFCRYNSYGCFRGLGGIKNIFIKSAFVNTNAL